MDSPSPQRILLARSLRQSSTDAERRMWYLLRSRRLSGYKFRRQFPVGSYIVDFCCYEHRLIVELDGGQHSGNTNDQSRTEYLQSKEFRVIRFWNDVVLKETDAVCQVILDALQKESF